MRSTILLGSAAVTAISISALASRGEAIPSRPDLCRQAPALERLPPEVPFDAQQQMRYDGRYAPPPPPPPAPPPPPVSERGAMERSEAVVAIGRSVSPSAKSPPPAIAAPEASSDVAVSSSRRPHPGWHSPPAGLLTAGDHDDLLNPRLYARYVWRAARDLGQSIVGLPRVDTSRVLTVAVEDQRGRPAPFVPVTVRCANGASLTYTTLADGKVTFYPDLDQLGQRVDISAGRSRRAVTIDPTAGGQTQTLVVHASAKAVRKLDLMIALDTTGSMGDEIAFLKSELRSIVGTLRHDFPGLDVRVGLVNYRDEGDAYVTDTLGLDGRLERVQAKLDVTRGEGGGDMPEAMDQALIRATGQAWRPDAARVMLLVADAPPHDEMQGRAFAAAQAARARRVQIVPVASSGVDSRAEYFMRATAALTQSRYIFLTDDSGIGNAHAEPDVACYVVTQLATSIRRVLASMVSGERIEPVPAEVIRTVGRYDHGKCVLPRNFDPQQ